MTDRLQLVLYKSNNVSYEYITERKNTAAAADAVLSDCLLCIQVIDCSGSASLLLFFSFTVEASKSRQSSSSASQRIVLERSAASRGQKEPDPIAKLKNNNSKIKKRRLPAAEEDRTAVNWVESLQ